MKERTVYISGPMEGKRNNNKKAFDELERILKPNYVVINPFYLEVDKQFQETKSATRQDFYRKDIRALTYCTDIVLMKGWNTSHGAQLERLIALEMGLKIHYEDGIENGKFIK